MPHITSLSAAALLARSKTHAPRLLSLYILPSLPTNPKSLRSVVLNLNKRSSAVTIIKSGSPGLVFQESSEKRSLRFRDWLDKNFAGGRVWMERKVEGAVKEKELEERREGDTSKSEGEGEEEGGVKKEKGEGWIVRVAGNKCRIVDGIEEFKGALGEAGLGEEWIGAAEKAEGEEAGKGS